MPSQHPGCSWHAHTCPSWWTSRSRPSCCNYRETKSSIRADHKISRCLCHEDEAQHHDIAVGRRSNLVSIVSLAAAHWASQQRSPAVAAALTVEEVTPPVAPAGPLSEMERAVIKVFEQTTNSVVNITDTTLQVSSRMAQVDQPEGNGTGFVWDKEGHIITNFHVLGSALQQASRRTGAKDVKVARVTLVGTDGASRSFDGILVGADRSKDLAVLRINVQPEQLQPVTLGASEKIRVGQQVLCIGNPFGFDHTLTTGVVSGVGREIQSRAGVLIGGGIQTDAAINPGNSGGPLLDSGGRVIGVNTAIFTNTGTSAGVGFAIPVDAVARAVPQLIQYGKIIRPSLRIQVAPEGVAAALQVGKGALVQSVDPASNAGKAGLLGTRRTFTGIAAGDVIVGLDDRRISNPGDLLSALDDREIGDKVVLKARRDASNGSQGQPFELQIVLEEA